MKYISWFVVGAELVAVPPFAREIGTFTLAAVPKFPLYVDVVMKAVELKALEPKEDVENVSVAAVVLVDTEM